MTSSIFGELCLVLGDLHIPTRAAKIPAPLKRMLVPNKMQHVICTGNLSADDFAELCTLAPNVHVVAGDYDRCEANESSMSAMDPPGSSSLVFPESRVLQLGDFRLGVIHGHQLLPWHSRHAIARMRRTLNVDILIAGHVHQHEVAPEEGYINPGSITGAYSSLTENVRPSFVLLAVQGNRMTCYLYELDDKEEVKISKTEFTKKETTLASRMNTGTNPALLESLLK